MTNAYWYTQHSGKYTHVVFASTKSIAQWYIDTCPDTRNATFVHKCNRPATKQEEYTVLAHTADKAVREVLVEMKVNGGSAEYIAKLRRLVSKIK